MSTVGAFDKSELIIMDFNLNEYPTGGIFGSGYDGSVLADGLDTKSNLLGRPLVYMKLPSNGSTSDFQQSRLLRLNRFCLQEISAKLLPKERVSFCASSHFKRAGVKVLFNPVREKKRIMAI